MQVLWLKGNTVSEVLVMAKITCNGQNKNTLLLIPMSDQNRISPYNFITISSRQVMRMKKILIWRLSVDPIPNSPNYHRENYYSRQEGQ